ncbi:hypothetical protein C8R45DRAFT_1028491 [Mycena sanguinolenta]|nr:hypothetical protein C8R45DRAFT_1028491 [Mycena sanguinolenta]
MPVPVGPTPSAAQRRSVAGEIRIYHTAVERGPPFLRLAVYARDDDFAPGLPFRFVCDACFILANNTAGQFEQWHDVVDGEQRSYTRVVLDDDDLLEPGEYTYLVEGNPNYAVCPSFRSWRPPPMVPPHWQNVDGVTGVCEIFGGETESSASQIALALDKCCAITGAIDRLQACRLVPAAEEHWWKTRRMYHHAASLFNSTTATSTNLLTMRSDLNAECFDEAHFLLFPYQGKWATFFTSDRSPDLAFDHHFCATRIPERVHAIFLYARFARNVFKLAGAHLDMLVEELSYIGMVPLKRKASQQGGRTASGSEASEATPSTCGSKKNERIVSPAPLKKACCRQKTRKRSWRSTY